MDGRDVRMSGRVLGRGMIKRVVFKRLSLKYWSKEEEPSAVPVERKIAGEGLRPENII